MSNSSNNVTSNKELSTTAIGTNSISGVTPGDANDRQQHVELGEASSSNDAIAKTVIATTNEIHCPNNSVTLEDANDNNQQQLDVACSSNGVISNNLSTTAIGTNRTNDGVNTGDANGKQQQLGLGEASRSNDVNTQSFSSTRNEAYNASGETTDDVKVNNQQQLDVASSSKDTTTKKLSATAIGTNRTNDGVTPRSAKGKQQQLGLGEASSSNDDTIQKISATRNEAYNTSGETADDVKVNNQQQLGEAALQKRQRRLAMNRVTARARRKRKREHIDSLKDKVELLTIRNDELRFSNNQLKGQISYYKNILDNFMTGRGSF